LWERERERERESELCARELIYRASPSRSPLRRSVAKFPLDRRRKAGRKEVTTAL